MIPLGLTNFSCIVGCTPVLRFMLGEELTGLQSYLITELDFSKVNFYICANADLKLLCCLFSFLD